MVSDTNRRHLNAATTELTWYFVRSVLQTPVTSIIATRTGMRNLDTILAGYRDKPFLNERKKGEEEEEEGGTLFENGSLRSGA